MPEYKHLFFDLDKTLWDYKANTREAFEEIFAELFLHSVIPDFEKFLSVYEKYNNSLWALYQKGGMKKDYFHTKKFQDTFLEAGINDPELSKRVGEMFVNRVCLKPKLFPKVHETLDYLHKKYNLYLLTNGFEIVQMRKVNNSGLTGYFKRFFMPEMAGYQKPDKRFFEYAVKSIHAHKKDCLMIGDEMEADIMGAARAGIDQAYFNPAGKVPEFKPTFEIGSMDELMRIL